MDTTAPPRHATADRADPDRSDTAGGADAAVQATFLHRQFEVQAHRRPDATALVFEDRALAYGALNRRANRLARRLRALGVQPDDRVALWMERGMDLMASTLGVLKAGAGYVPLDPSYPPDRVAVMLADCAPALVLCTRRLRDDLPGTAAPVICIDDPRCADELARLPDDDLPEASPALAPQHLACIIYTSGSTGVPKGVMLQHDGLANLLRALPEVFRVDEDSRVLQFSSPSFDASLLDIALALCFGGRLCLAPREALLPGDPLLHTLRQHGVTHVTLPPSALAVLDPGVRLPTVQTLCVAGEVCSPAVTRRWAPQHRLVNIYGPTETTIFVTAEVCAAEYPGPTPIGHPVADAQIHILDEQLRPVAPGERGELYVGGACVSRGYLHKPELTAQRFLPDPFSTRPGARMYKTGDIGRRLPAGNVEYSGRSDFQVKIRGFRVELGEIESRLAQCKPVREAVVVCREDVPGDKRLVAYLTAVTPDAARPRPEALRAVLARQLPEYMLPAACVWLERFPLTPNGKTHRAALPPPRPQDHAMAHFAPPEGATEIALARLWQDVLRLDRIGRDDSFFALGGHSLMATQLASRVQAHLGVELPLRVVFAQPTLQAQARWIDDAGSRKPTSTRGADEAAAPVPRLPRDRPLPCSYSQRRMWLAQQFTPQTTAYNVAIALRLRGPLEAEALAQALDATAARHEAFRTRFEMHGDEPMQLIEAHRTVELPLIDLSPLPPAAREDEARRLLGTHTARPFDLSAPPLHRTLLLRLDAKEHVLLWVMHHIISDLWSLGLLLDEALRELAARSAGTTLQWPARAFDHADYAARERDPAHQARLGEQYGYWHRRLQGLQPLELPCDHPRRGPLSGRGGSLHAPLPHTLTEGLRRLCQRLGATPFMALLACYTIVLARRSGQHDFAVAVPIANRHRLESEGLVGTLVNTLAMRVDVSRHPSFAELLAQVHETALQAYAHQDVPFEHLVERHGQRGHKLHAPLAQVLFNVHNVPFAVHGHAGLDVTAFPFDEQAAQFELALSADIDVFHQVTLEYSTDLYQRATAQRLLDGYVALIGQVLEDPHRAIGDYLLLGTPERELLAAWNGTDVPLPAAARVDTYVLHGQPTDDTRWALRDAGGGLSAAALDAQVNRLAHALRVRGIGRGALVGLCVERSVAMVAAQLAILRAGAAYVPLDPAYPAARLQFMAQDAALALLVTESLPMVTLGWSPERCMLLDVEADTIAAGPETPLPPDPARDAGPDDPAYVIYTSGSSGTPKGVVVPHRAVLNFLAAMRRQPGIGSDDTLLAVTTLSFDIAVLELLVPLAAGGRVVLARREEAQDGFALRDLLESSGATLMQATPSTWQMLIDSGWRGASGFRALVGGEPLSAPLATALLERCDALWNMYGPTETTVWSTCWRVESPQRAIRIGTPIDNTQVHVLDDRLQPCPIGVPGEICIGGTGVALGYLNRPALSAERFRERDGGIVYRTGDRGRWCGDGRLEHLGRLDFQVKVRGHRIELGEIESQLVADARVAQCVVLLREDRPGDARLVAYVVPRSSAPDVAELRQRLREQLPEFMVPQHCMLLPELPRLPNGKIDRHALPAPTEAALVHDRDFWVPRTDTEVALAEIWRGLLQVDRLSSSDNFFDLGGHSLLAMRAVGEVQRRLGVRLEVRRLVFETLAQLAAAIDAAQAPATAATPAVRERTSRYLIGGLKRMLAGKNT